MVQKIEETIDLEKIISLAREAEDFFVQPKEQSALNVSIEEGVGKFVRIGIAKDKAFTFYYQDSLELLESLGAELITFSPLDDRELPDNLDGIIIGGGYPETFLNALANNYSFKEDLKEKAEQGLPIYAECGGQMYLSEEIIDFDGRSYPMVGLVPGKSKMHHKLVAMGYVTAEVKEDNILLTQGESYKGHEFHYSSLEGIEDKHKALRLVKNRDGSIKHDGFKKENILTSYVHLHMCGFPHMAENFIRKCYQFKKERSKDGN